VFSDRSERTHHARFVSPAADVVQMEYEPEGMKESVGSAVGIDSHRVKGDLESFKEFIESRGAESGAWRGNVNEN
jgi:hypothetical protein